MNSIEALDFAITRLGVDRGRFVHVENHDAALATLIALREYIADMKETREREEAHS